MSQNVKELPRQQIIDEDMLRRIEEICVAARRGEVTEIVVVVRDNESYMRMASFSDRIRLMGYMMYALHAVDNASDPQKG